MTVGGPEAIAQSDQNRYTPEWLSMDQLAGENLKPETPPRYAGAGSAERK